MDMNDLKKQLEAERSQHSKAAHWIQLILFLLLFTGLFLLGCKVFSGFWMRALCLLIAYFVSSMVTFVIIKPAIEKIEAKNRNRK